MSSDRLVPPRDPNCAGQFHGFNQRRRGCTCPLSDAERASRQRRAARKLSGRKQVAVWYSAEVDETNVAVAIERAMRGDVLPRMTIGERIAAAVVLTEHHRLSALEIAERLRCNARTVCRYRQRAVRARAEATSC